MAFGYGIAASGKQKSMGVLNTKTWLVWLVAAATGALITRNPLYLCLALLTSAVIGSGRRPANEPATLTAWARLAAVLGMVVALLNALTAHYGSTVLFSIPRDIPLLGGPITLEALAFGVTGGMSLAATIFAFVVFNAHVSPQSLLRLAPRFAYRMSVAVSIAVLFVPQTVASFHQIREAQQLRGHRLRGWRDWLPLLAPLLTLSLERALALAEAMEARGFGGRTTRDDSADGRNSVWLLVGATGFGLGFFLHIYEHALEPLGTSVAIGGLALVAWRLWRSGRDIHRSRYRTETWTTHDVLVLVAALIALAALLAYNIATDNLIYYPYPRLMWPPFDPLIGTVYLLLATPATLGRKGNKKGEQEGRRLEEQEHVQLERAR